MPREDIPLSVINTDSSSSSEATSIDLRVEIHYTPLFFILILMALLRDSFNQTNDTTYSSSPESVLVVTSTSGTMHLFNNLGNGL